MNEQLIATLGPSSQTEAIWRDMLAAGVTTFRLNTSHLSLAALHGWLERLDAFFSALPQPPPALVLDLQGSKWRLGQFPGCELAEGAQVELVLAPETQQPATLPVPHADFFSAAALSDGEVVLNDARVRLKLLSVGSTTARARVTQPGSLAPHKGITLAASAYRVERLSEKDQALVTQTRSLPGVGYAVSYIKDALEMVRYRNLIGVGIPLAAKLERAPAMADAAAIAAVADTVWLCRGDLGAELGLVEMAAAVSRFSAQVRALGKPAIMAGQVLEHMTEHATPTRSEVCYLYDTLRAGYAGVVLSDETAIGRYPLQSCQAAAMFSGR